MRSEELRRKVGGVGKSYRQSTLRWHGHSRGREEGNVVKGFRHGSFMQI